jgi:hypothetical protein
MTTLAQRSANLSNSPRSTGPRSAEGKGVVAKNAIRHGILAAVSVVMGEDKAEWDEFRYGSWTFWGRM